MKLDYEEMTLAVKEAATILDEKFPRWEQAIDLETFDISDARRCVLGQMGFDRGRGYAEMWWLVEEEIERTDYPWAFDLGNFKHAAGEEAAYIDDEDWRLLNRAWLTYLQEHRD